VNPECGREGEITASTIRTPMKVLVAGGGVAGLKAAVIAAQRGNRVTVYEKGEKLGGQFLLASMPPNKGERKNLIIDISTEAKKLGVKIELSREVTPALIEEIKPDVAIIATGSLPIVPEIRGVERKHVVLAVDVLDGKSPVGMNVLIIGGGSVGLETASYLAAKGRNVKVVEMKGHFAPNMGRIARFALRRHLDKDNVELIKNCVVEEIGDEIIKVKKNERQELLYGINTIVLAVGSKSNDEIAQNIKEEVKRVFVIGDAAEPTGAMEAVFEGWEAARQI